MPPVRRNRVYNFCTIRLVSFHKHRFHLTSSTFSSDHRVTGNGSDERCRTQGQLGKGINNIFDGFHSSLLSKTNIFRFMFWVNLSFRVDFSVHQFRVGLEGLAQALYVAGERRFVDLLERCRMLESPEQSQNHAKCDQAPADCDPDEHCGAIASAKA